MTKAKHQAFDEGPFRLYPRVRDGQPTGAWVVDIPPHLSPTGKRQRLNFPTKTAAQAEARRLLRELQIDGAISGTGQKLSGLTFSELSERWFKVQQDRVETKKKRPISLENQAFRLKNLLAELGPLDVAKITAATLIAYQKTRLDAGRSAPTINSETTCFTQIFRWAREHDLVSRVPKIEAIPVPRKRVDLPTIDELIRVLECLPPRIALLVRTTAETGCRKSEIFNLEIDDLDEANAIVRVWDKEGGWRTKNDSSCREIPVSPALMSDLVQVATEARKEAMAMGWPNQNLIFPGKGGVIMTSYRKTLATAIKAAGVTRNGAALHVTPHDLRRAHATYLKRRGVDDMLLQARLGHVPGSKVTAQAYVHLTTDDQRSAVIDLAERGNAR